MRTSVKVRIAAGLAAVGVLAAGGAAYAYWRLGGGVSSSTVDSTLTPVTAEAVFTVAGMTPGESHPIEYRLTNTTNSIVKVHELRADLTVTAVGGLTCPASSFSLDTVYDDDANDDGVADNSGTAVASKTYALLGAGVEGLQLMGGMPHPIGPGDVSEPGYDPRIYFNNLVADQTGCRGATVRISLEVG